MSDTEVKEEQLLVPIAKPLAGPKLSKTLFNLVKEGIVVCDWRIDEVGINRL